MDLEGLVAEARERRPQPMPQRERLYAAASAAAFLGAVALLGAVLTDQHLPAQPALLVVPVLLYAVGARCQFETGNGFAMPTQIVFIPMLFLAPLPLVPLMVAAGDLLARLPDFLLKRQHYDRWIHSFSPAWFVVGPVLVIGLLAPGPPRMQYIGVYALALLAQCVMGIAEVVVADRVMYGTPPAQAI